MAKVRKIPQRSCVACGRARPKRELIRVVRTPAGTVQVDLTGKVSGRGAYVCPEAPCIERGVRGGRLPHALEAPVSPELSEELVRAAALVAAGRR
ncbi:MAG TPA: YlxR family protein [bacterium]|nr:YlxR family protein [bacterium]